MGLLVHVSKTCLRLVLRFRDFKIRERAAVPTQDQARRSWIHRTNGHSFGLGSVERVPVEEFIEVTLVR